MLGSRTLCSLSIQTINMKMPACLHCPWVLPHARTKLLLATCIRICTSCNTAPTTWHCCCVDQAAAQSACAWQSTLTLWPPSLAADKHPKYVTCSPPDRPGRVPDNVSHAAFFVPNRHVRPLVSCRPAPPPRSLSLSAQHGQTRPAFVAGRACTGALLRIKHFEDDSELVPPLLRTVSCFCLLPCNEVVHRGILSFLDLFM